jgi:inner membrane protein
VAIGELNFSSEKTTKFWLLGALCAVIPDADAIGYWMGVPYDSLWGHRGITHSLFFAALLAAMVMYVFYRPERPFCRAWWMLYATFFISTASHAVLDAFTTGGLGVAFFAPFWDERYFFPWRVIRVSPISVTRFFSDKGIQVLKSEWVWVWIPSLAVILISRLIRRWYPGLK